MKHIQIVTAFGLAFLASANASAQQVDLASSSEFGGFDATDLNAGGGFGWSDGVGHSQQGATGKRLEIGINAMSQNRFEKADASFSAILNRSPRNLKALIFSGAARELQGNWLGAVERYRAAAILKPSEVYLQQLLGVTYAKAGNRLEAADIRAGLIAWSDLCSENCTDAAALKTALAAIDAAL
jgi:tetratricopeptide (TPR) repeat protein